MKKRLPLILILLAALGAAGYWYFTRNGNPDGRILVSGNIELNEISVAFKTGGRLIERAVNEGDPVKKGQVLARLDRDQLTAQRDRDSAALAAATVQLAQAETALEWQRATLAGDIEQRRADLASSEARLAELEAKSARR